jgi:hypothetical protein
MPYLIVFLCLLAAVVFYFMLRSMQRQEGLPAPPLPLPPAWAAFFSPVEWQQFHQAVRGYFEGRGQPFRIDDGVVTLLKEDGTPEEATFGLGNLAQLCHQVPRKQWRELIAMHFGQLETAQRESEALQARMADFAQVRDMLMVRLAEEGALPAEMQPVAREHLPGIVSYLVFDLPTTVQTLRREMIEPWGLSDDELFAVALDNVHAQVVPEITRQPLRDGPPCLVMSGESFFIGTHALLLRHHPECLGRAGALVAVPNRHCVITYPIDGLDVLQVTHLIAIVAINMYREGPGSISPRLYWYHDGAFTDLPYEIRNNTVEFTPPEEFLTAVSQFAVTAEGCL